MIQPHIFLQYNGGGHLVHPFFIPAVFFLYPAGNQGLHGQLAGILLIHRLYGYGGEFFFKAGDKTFHQRRGMGVFAIEAKRKAHNHFFHIFLQKIVFQKGKQVFGVNGGKAGGDYLQWVGNGDTGSFSAVVYAEYPGQNNLNLLMC